MSKKRFYWPLWSLAAVQVAIAGVTQGPEPAEYQRALQLGTHYASLVEGEPSQPSWVDATHFIYRRGVARQGRVPALRYLQVDAISGEQQPLFETPRLAAALIQAGAVIDDADALDLRGMSYTSPASLQFTVGRGGKRWQCDLSVYHCQVDPDTSNIYSFDLTPPLQQGPAYARRSPDGAQRAWVEHGNLVVARADGSELRQLSHDGSEQNYYIADSIAWSPDSSQLVAGQVKPPATRIVHYIESAPADQLQPKLHQQAYQKPGDELAQIHPVMFEVASGHMQRIDDALFPNAFSLSQAQWWRDGRGFTFEYNQRGHQLYRVIEVDAHSGKARTLIEERSPTFIEYSELSGDQYNGGKHYRYDLDDGAQMLWASERDGWEHLYLYDGKRARVLRQLTKGAWPLRKVDRVDEARRQIWFSASGRNADEDPYYRHAYRLSLDGGTPVALTPEIADHEVLPSPDGRWLLDLYSRVDLAPLLVLRKADDGSVVREVARTDISRLLAAGWQPPLPFHASGRDGKTAIWGVIHRPQALDASKRYPVVENIYAGPQGSFVPKTFSTRVEPLTALGFAVAQIDGMGTNNRSRAFHDVAWRNLKDGGFADRIAWHKAAAAQYAWYDIDAGVGIFGTSAGGQNALAGLLFHPEFYVAGVANSGSHDNRMDKIWWNEQWMGWPIGPWYSASSNVDNAWRLQGHLLLVTGDMDMNVDPASTFQVADRLIKAGKDFDLLLVPGGDHGAGGDYGQRRLLDFFVRWLQQKTTPQWNSLPASPSH